MPHFCKCGADEYICQQCGRIQCSREDDGVWALVPRTGREGNLCTRCFSNINAMSKLNRFLKKKGIIGVDNKPSL